MWDPKPTRPEDHQPQARGIGDPLMIRRSRLLGRAGIIALAVATPLVFTAPAQAATEEVWDRIAACESSGNWSISTGNGYHGGLQFLDTTWDSFGGEAYAATADRATRAQQIDIAERVLDGQGWGAWPVCSRKAGVR
jgi:resuscitation-promoting factor RpfA